MTDTKFHVEQIGAAKLFLGRAEDVLPTLPIATMQCVTDPPYVFNASGGGSFRYARKCLDRIQDAGLTEGFDHSLITSEQFRSVVVFAHNDQIFELGTYLNTQFKRVVVCTWHKSNPMPVANKHYLPDTEYYLHAWNPGAAPAGSLQDKARYWIGQTGKQSTYDHPTVKPIDLMRKIVRNCNKDSDYICDPFMGTGTTGAAALIQGWPFIGIEKEPRFFDMAVHRIKRLYADGLVKAVAA